MLILVIIMQLYGAKFSSIWIFNWVKFYTCYRTAKFICNRAGTKKSICFYSMHYLLNIRFHLNFYWNITISFHR